MNLTFAEITSDSYPVLHEMMLSYYRSDEDNDLSDAALSDYISTLYDLVQAQVLLARLAQDGDRTVGFLLAAEDKRNTDFYELPGHGTIMELYVEPDCRRQGLGTQLVQEAERLLREKKVKGFYVCAYDKALPFWTAMGYADRGEVGSNGLPLLQKSL